MFTKDNFFKSTYAEFKHSKRVFKRGTDYISNSGSVYWYTKTGVYRLSDHWGDVASCHWDIDVEDEDDEDGYTLGFCKWINFCSVNNEKVKAKQEQLRLEREEKYKELEEHIRLMRKYELKVERKFIHITLDPFYQDMINIRVVMYRAILNYLIEVTRNDGDKKFYIERIKELNDAGENYFKLSMLLFQISARYWESLLRNGQCILSEIDYLKKCMVRSLFSEPWVTEDYADIRFNDFNMIILKQHYE